MESLSSLYLMFTYINGFLTGHPLEEGLPVDVDEGPVEEDVATVTHPDRFFVLFEERSSPLDQLLRFREGRQSREKALDLGDVTRTEKFLKIDHF